MRSEQFDKVVERRIALIQEILLRKRAEYAPDGGDRLHNFNRAADMMRSTPERALMGMLAKHLVSLLDITDAIPATIPTEPVLEEKIGDAINYLILLEGMVKGRIHGD